MKHFMQQLR